MFSKVNFTDIVVEHINTLHDYNRTKINKSEFSLFFIIPLLALPISVFATLNNNMASLIATITSIFSALLFNVQVLVCDIKLKIAVKKKDALSESKRRHDLDILELLSAELYTSISFCIILTIFTLIILFLWYLLNISFLNKIFPLYTSYILIILSGMIYYLLIVFFLTLLLVTKRAYALVMTEIIEEKALCGTTSTTNRQI